MNIDKTQEMITIKVDKTFKERIIKQSNMEDKSVSEFIRDLINNELTRNDILKNQSYLSEVLDTIIKNIIDEKMNTINKILESLYLKQELIIYLLKTFDEDNFENKIEEFTTSYLGDNLRTIL